METTGNREVDRYLREATRQNIEMLQLVRDLASCLGMRSDDDKKTLDNLKKYVKGALNRREQ